MKEIKFKKYLERGHGYHWKQISKSVRDRNIFVVARYETILDLIGNEVKNKKVLDVGCGDGVLSFMLAFKGGKVIGIDNSKEAIKFAKEQCKDLKNLNFQIASVYNLPFEDKSFDYIVASEIIEHLRHPEKMISELKRVWNQKGKIVITTPIRFTEKPIDKMHYQEFFEDEFKRLLEKYFEKVKIFKSHPLIWAEFQQKLILGRAFPKLILNCLNIIFGFNPFKSKKNWKYYTLQIALIE